MPDHDERFFSAAQSCTATKPRWNHCKSSAAHHGCIITKGTSPSNSQTIMHHGTIPFSKWLWVSPKHMHRYWQKESWTNKRYWNSFWVGGFFLLEENPREMISFFQHRSWARWAPLWLCCYLHPWSFSIGHRICKGNIEWNPPKCFWGWSTVELLGFWGCWEFCFLTLQMFSPKRCSSCFVCLLASHFS